MAEKAVLEVMLTYERPFIVLCQNRGEAEGLARLCAAYFGVEKIRFYHSELTDEEKKAVEEWFCASEDGILTTSGALGIKICLSGIAGVIQTGSQEVSDVFMKDKEFAFNFIRKNRAQ